MSSGLTLKEKMEIGRESWRSTLLRVLPFEFVALVPILVLVFVYGTSLDEFGLGLAAFFFAAFAPYVFAQDRYCNRLIAHFQSRESVCPECGKQTGRDA
ncbi:MAG: hypothetical protein IID31_12875 [Planctomycetes bacterium]|nr:hypothetical protein [Planctomycetota bacterium]